MESPSRTTWPASWCRSDAKIHEPHVAPSLEIRYLRVQPSVAVHLTRATWTPATAAVHGVSPGGKATAGWKPGREGPNCAGRRVEVSRKEHFMKKILMVLTSVSEI